MLQDKFEAEIPTERYYKEHCSGFTYHKRFLGIKGRYVNELEKRILINLIGDVKGKKILDVGCGTGRFTNILTRMGAKVTAIDPSPEMISYAKRQFKECRFEIGDIKNMRFPDDSFDVVVAMRVLIHFHDKKKALEEMVRVVKPGRMVVFDCANALRFDLPAKLIKRFLGIADVCTDFTFPHKIKQRHHHRKLKIRTIIGVKMLPPLSFLVRFLGQNRMILLELLLGKTPLKYLGSRCYILATKRGKVK